MYLKNNFKKEDIYRVWGDVLWCANCSSNEMTSPHHIYSRCSSSVANSIPLCISCHRIADGQNIHQTGNPLQIKYLGLAMRQIVKAGYEFTENDKRFLESIEKDVQEVLHS